MRRLGRLNLVNRPMTRAEGEWAYLTRNLQAQGLATHPKVTAALAEAKGLEDAVYFDLVTARQHDAIGLDATQLRTFTRDLLLEAEARALSAKVRVLRDGIAYAKGLADGDALAAQPGYDPTPQVAGGRLEWRRFDVTANPGAVDEAFGSRGLTHRVSSAEQLLALFRNGGELACTERRRLIGTFPARGLSYRCGSLRDRPRTRRFAPRPDDRPTARSSSAGPPWSCNSRPGWWTRHRRRSKRS